MKAEEAARFRITRAICAKDAQTAKPSEYTKEIFRRKPYDTRSGKKAQPNDVLRENETEVRVQNSNGLCSGDIPTQAISNAQKQYLDKE